MKGTECVYVCVSLRLHGVIDSKCPLFVKAVQLLRARADYGT